MIALGATVMGSAGTWAPSLISLTADLNSMLFTEVARPAAPAAATQGEMVQKWALTATGDAAWRYFVVDPWAVQEFGSMDAASRYAQDGIPGGLLLAQAPGRRLDWYWTQSPAVRERDLGWWSEDAMPRRLTLAAVSTAGALVYAAGLLLLAGGVLVYQLTLLLLLMAAPVLFLLALWPGFGQRWLSRWVEGVLRSVVGQTLYACLLGILVILTAVSSSLEGSLGWELAALLLAGAAAGIFLVRRWLSVRRRGRAVGTVCCSGRPAALPPATRASLSQPAPPIMSNREHAATIMIKREHAAPSA